MRKTLAALLGAALVITLGACSSAPSASTSASAGASAAGKTIYVLGPTPDHGWTAQAGTYAEAKVAEIKAAGKYKAEYQASSDGEAQNDLVQNIIANGDAAGVVFFGLDDSAKSGQEALIAAKIPFISFDRIIEGPDKSAVLNFSGDNWAVGAGIGYWLQKNGMEPGDTLVTLIGDNGTVSGRRQEGFDQFLTGTKDYNDKDTGTTSKTTKVWTQPEVDALSSKYKVVCDWSADAAYQYLEQTLPDIIKDAKTKGGKLFVFSMDDEMTFGFMNLLEGNTLDDSAKKDLKDLNVYTSAIGGMQELYDVMAGTAPQSKIANELLRRPMSIYFSPKMMTTAVDYMVKYLDGTDWKYKVGDGEYEPTFIVDKGNVSKYKGFSGH